MRKLIQLFFVAVLLAMSLVTAASASATYPIYPFFDQEITVQSGDEIRLQYHWDATSRGLMNMFFNHTDTSHLLVDEDDNVILNLSGDDAAALWSPMEQIDSAALGLACPQPKHWYSEVDYALPELEPGVYTLVSVGSMSNPVNDGWHTCTNLETGEPVSYTPSLYPTGTTFAGTITITVE